MADINALAPIRQGYDSSGSAERLVTAEEVQRQGNPSLTVEQSLTALADIPGALAYRHGVPTTSNSTAFIVVDQDTGIVYGLDTRVANAYSYRVIYNPASTPSTPGTGITETEADARYYQQSQVDNLIASAIAAHANTPHGGASTPSSWRGIYQTDTTYPANSFVVWAAVIWMTAAETDTEPADDNSHWQRLTHSPRTDAEINSLIQAQLPTTSTTLRRLASDTTYSTESAGAIVDTRIEPTTAVSVDEFTVASPFGTNDIPDSSAVVTVSNLGGHAATSQSDPLGAVALRGELKIQSGAETNWQNKLAFTFYVERKRAGENFPMVQLGLRGFPSGQTNLIYLQEQSGNLYLAHRQGNLDSARFSDINGDLELEVGDVCKLALEYHSTDPAAADSVAQLEIVAVCSVTRGDVTTTHQLNTGSVNVLLNHFDFSRTFIYAGNAPDDERTPIINVESWQTKASTAPTDLLRHSQLLDRLIHHYPPTATEKLFGFYQTSPVDDYTLHANLDVAGELRENGFRVAKLSDIPEGEQGPQGVYDNYVYRTVSHGDPAPATPTFTSYDAATDNYVGLTSGWAQEEAPYDETTHDLYEARMRYNPATGVASAFGQPSKRGADRGATGPAGEQGPAGAQGPIGPMGVQGPAGPQGAMGSTGPAGPQGDQGPQGNPGTTGQQGETGPAGSDGDDGWSPILAVVSDGTRRVLQLSSWSGGDGSEPTTSGSYLASSGLVSSIAEGADIRGPAGTASEGNGYVELEQDHSQSLTFSATNTLVSTGWTIPDDGNDAFLIQTTDANNHMRTVELTAATMRALVVKTAGSTTSTLTDSEGTISFGSPNASFAARTWKLAKTSSNILLISFIGFTPATHTLKIFKRQVAGSAPATPNTRRRPESCTVSRVDSAGVANASGSHIKIDLPSGVTMNDLERIGVQFQIASYSNLRDWGRSVYVPIPIAEWVVSGISNPVPFGARGAGYLFVRVSNAVQASDTSLIYTTDDANNSAPVGAISDAGNATAIFI